MSEFEAVTLTDPSSSLTATVVPMAGMIVTSLRDGEHEFLGQRRGLDAYITAGKTMGVPILYPWANRLSANDYGINGAVVTLTPGTGGVRTDEHGVPIHGVLTGYPGWLVSDRSDNSLTAVLDFGGRPRLLASFPFPHVLTQRMTLEDRTLTVETTVTPTTAASVPLCFGYHPYLQLPGSPARRVDLTTPTMRHRPVDDLGLPDRRARRLGGHLGGAGLHRLRRRLRPGARGCGVRHLRRRPPRRGRVPRRDIPPPSCSPRPTTTSIAIEPMAAPTDALRRGDYRFAVAGKPETTRFSIRVT